MPAPFKQITRQQFALLLNQFPFTRKINAVHMHHTWRPNRSQYKGHDTIVAMWAYHTQHNGWADIAQHITIAPDGTIWLGRDWNRPPASSAGQNGTSQAGPFMFEMVGDFDKDQDPFDAEQRATALEVIVRVQKKFGLAPGSLMFHNMMSPKTCPGSAISYPDVLQEVSALHASLDATTRGPSESDGVFPADALEFAQITQEALEDLARAGLDVNEPSDAEPCAARDNEDFVPKGIRAAARDSGLSPAQLQALRPYLVNLTMGQFSTEGEWKTSRGDVDAIFDENLPRALKKARQNGEPLRLVFYAHGGLNSESIGLQIAQKSVAWWQENNIYPIYFVWETGAFETINQLISRARQGASRAVPRDIFDFTTDPLIQETVRALQGPRIWGGMKLSAELASAKDTVANNLSDASAAAKGAEGGAYYVARRLAAFCKSHPGQVELHAAGHSAGSIFHAHFIPRAVELGVPNFRSVQFMAPAVRVDLFKQQLVPLMGTGKGIDHLTLFTMHKDFEENDNCGSVYRKSLLYLIYYALEPERKTAILGLELTLRGDPDLKKLFGLGTAKADGEIVWSVSALQQGRSASTSTSHGGFDDDGPTMSSIARRILGKADADRIVEYVTGQTGTRGAGAWNPQVDWPRQLSGPYTADSPPPAFSPPLPAPPTIGNAAFTPGRGMPTGEGASRRALCIGINRYPTAPLQGCVTDAQTWAAMFRQLGFNEPAMLLDEQATRAAMIDSLQTLVRNSRAGDVIVFQYSGHGTELPDLNGDEAAYGSSKTDQAFCPYDFANGAFLLDDDVGNIFDSLPTGVNLTCFIDCCHSGSISRLAVALAAGATSRGADERPRFIHPTAELIEAHRRYRARSGTISPGSRARIREVLFAACRSDEVAWESAGQGEFTVRAMHVFQQGIDDVANELFAQRVTAEFGQNPRQHTQLFCDTSARPRLLLQPTASVPPAVPAMAYGSDSRSDHTTMLLNGLEQLIRQFRPHN